MTGVQTCALPISVQPASLHPEAYALPVAGPIHGSGVPSSSLQTAAAAAPPSFNLNPSVQMEFPVIGRTICDCFVVVLDVFWEGAVPRPAESLWLLIRPQEGILPSSFSEFGPSPLYRVSLGPWWSLGRAISLCMNLAWR